MIKVKEIYLEDVTGKGEYILTLVGEDGEKYQPEVDTHGIFSDVVFYRCREENE